MKVKDALAADYWIDNTQKIYGEKLHVSTPVMEAYVAGFEQAREHIIKCLINLDCYEWEEVAIRLMGEEYDGTYLSLYDQVIESIPKNERE